MVDVELHERFPIYRGVTLTRLIIACTLLVCLTSCSHVAPTTQVKEMTAIDMPSDVASKLKDTERVFAIIDGILALKSEVEATKGVYEADKANPDVVPYIEDRSYSHLGRLFSLAEQAKRQDDRFAAALEFVEISQTDVSELWTVNMGYEMGHFYPYAKQVWALYTGRSPSASQ